MTLVIGLTGSIASGKSTVSLMFDDFDIPVVDADKLARVVVRPGEKGYTEIVKTFGEDILRTDKTIDRKKLGEIVFADEGKRNKLNAIVHPAVREEMLKSRDALIETGAAAVVLDIPLLFESKLTHFVDRTIVVAVDPATQLKRLMERDGFTEEHARQRINSQMPITEKAKQADAVVDNNGTKSETYKQLQEILRCWQVL
ncbi:Dephospho-CoA kinase [Lentibacillus sp. JNUCC-1]|uniref:dephospho-CoA kinase n=1 Tax=Lentibacillus sp. JNUCC-1 TaxID=2654513 RepID=UPI001327B48C|nr:Dephospho-CoA kinase [Lentibacillus sp. JNUCC-1]